MPRGEFRLANGLIIPNTFTTTGMAQVMQAAFQHAVLTWNVGLCNKISADVVTLADLQEPGPTNGYARQALPLDAAHWPTIGTLNGETYVESSTFTIPAAGPLDAASSRLFLTDGAVVICISAPFPGGLAVISAPLITKYRLYFR